MDNPIFLAKGEVVGIGKVKVHMTEGFAYDIPLLSFITAKAKKVTPRKPRTPQAAAKEAKKAFVSTCINLRVNGYGETPEKAEADMVESTYFVLLAIFQMGGRSVEEAWAQILKWFKSDEWSNERWDAYSEVQIRQSMQGDPSAGHPDFSFRVYELGAPEKEREQLERSFRLVKN